MPNKHSVSPVTMSKATELSKKTESEAPCACANTCLASMLEKHRASIAMDLKNSFASLESRLEKIQTTVLDYGQRIISLETSTESEDQRIHSVGEVGSLNR